MNHEAPSTTGSRGEYRLWDDHLMVPALREAGLTRPAGSDPSDHWVVVPDWAYYAATAVSGFSGFDELDGVDCPALVGALVARADLRNLVASTWLLSVAESEGRAVRQVLLDELPEAFVLPSPACADA